MRVIAICAAALLVSCSHAEERASAEYLQPYPNSKVLQSVAQYGGQGVTYEVMEPYPAEPVIKFIESRIPPQFKVRKESFMNPGIPTSHVRGWTNYLDSSGKVLTRVDHWSGEWEDAAGNIVAYDLMYRSPSATSDLERPTTSLLWVNGGLLPRKMVDAARGAAEASSAPVDPKQFARPDYIVVRAKGDPKVVLDLRDFQETVTVRRMEPSGSYAVILTTNESGDRKLKSLTSANIGKQIEIYVDGELIAEPHIETPLSGTLLLNGGFSQSQAELIAQRVLTGGP